MRSRVLLILVLPVLFFTFSGCETLEKMTTKIGQSFDKAFDRSVEDVSDESTEVVTGSVEEVSEDTKNKILDKKNN